MVGKPYDPNAKQRDRFRGTTDIRANGAGPGQGDRVPGDVPSKAKSEIHWPPSRNDALPFKNLRGGK